MRGASAGAQAADGKAVGIVTDLTAPMIGPHAGNDANIAARSGKASAWSLGIRFVTICRFGGVPGT
ncbi:hypothetical protein ACWELO_26515 [Streptomyces sp. NPDC004596]